jgi:phosphoenolpyruvate-protein phosphotransferase
MSTTERPPSHQPAPPPPQHKRLARARRSEAERAVNGGPERRFVGIPTSPGIAIGAVFGAAEPQAPAGPTTIKPENIETERARLDAALTQSRRQVTKLRARLSVLPEESQEELAPLLDAYLRMLGPSRLLRAARRRIEEGFASAEAAVAAECDELAGTLLGQIQNGTPPDEKASILRRAEEVREIGRRLIRNLTRTPFRSFAGLPPGAILICEQLRPADAALLDPARLAAVATDEGGPEGHTAVMLRALGVPAVLGAAGVTHAMSTGELAVVDGTLGTVTLNPSEATLAEAKRAVTAFARDRQRLGRLRRLPARTQDGEDVELQANFELLRELPMIAQSGAHGIGLLRSEFLFMNRDTVPDEATQYESYRAIIEAMAGDSVTIRVLDWGGEKEIEALSAAGIVPDVIDVNPALGLRGIRLLLRRPELFETQMAAILRAAAHGPTRVMLPMVTTVSEVRAAREVMERVARRLRRRGERLPDTTPPLGIMIETPGAALSADALALEADFFAIGTNDLTAYTLAVDRAETDVATLYDPIHPAVLRLVQFATEAALRLRMPVSVCGEMAADPRMTRLLLGLGIRSFSMNAAAVPRVKQAVRMAEIGDCARFARRLMERSDPESIHAMIMGEDDPLG